MTLVRRNHGSSHSYWVDGVKAPASVTGILKQVPKPALVDWAARVTAEYATDHWARLSDLTSSARLRELEKARYATSKRAMARGTKVHALGEQLALGRQVDVPEPLAPLVDHYVAFLDTWGPEPIATELVVCNRQVGYCGTADLVAQMAGQTWLLDIKTGHEGSSIWPETALQLCAYARAETYTTPGEDGAESPMADLGIERCAAIQVRPDGWELVPTDASDEVWAYFRHLAWLWHRADQLPTWIGDPLDPPMRTHEHPDAGRPASVA